MKTNHLILASISLLLAGTASAQTSPSNTSNSTRSIDVYGARATDWEFTLGGSGASDNDFNNSLGGVNFAVGNYLTDSLELSVRQSVSYSNGSGGNDSSYDASTFAALDYHFGVERLRPFVGVNFGGLYGDNTNDTWAAGVEAGLKFYVKPTTFLYALVNYAWNFDDGHKATDNFNDGAFLWSVGVGFSL